MKHIFPILVIVMFAACNTSQNETVLQEKLTTFENNTELENYLSQAVDQQSGQQPEQSSPLADSGTNVSNTHITNNQENDVDEGGIVKNVGNFFLILRRGHLVSVRIENSLIRIDDKLVASEGLDSRVWYDELLVKENLIMVIGYRYNIIPENHHGATEINLFRMAEDGTLSREGTYFVESGDYFSGINYTSRLVNGKLVFYTPYSLRQLVDQSKALRLPRLFRYQRNQFESLGEILRAQDVIRPTQSVSWPVLHSVLVCNLENGFQCRTKTVVGSWRSTYYVTSKRAYLFIPGERRYPQLEQISPNLLYAMELEGNRSGVIQVRGTLDSQFFMNESGNSISLITTVDSIEGGRSFCDSLTTTASNARQTYVLNIPLASLGQVAQEPRAEHYSCLRNGTDYPTLARFNETHLLVTFGAETVVVKRSTNQIDRYPLSINPGRVELAGDDFMVVGSRPSTAAHCESSDLVFQLIQARESSSLGSSYTLPCIREGEWRSHGYFFHQGETFNTFGIATFQYNTQDTLNSAPTSVVGSSLHFLNIISNGSIAEAGQMNLQRFTRPSEQCSTSCIDWYGNTRPLFLQNKIFGLLGDQISLGSTNVRGEIEIRQSLNLMTGEVL